MASKIKIILSQIGSGNIKRSDAKGVDIDPEVLAYIYHSLPFKKKVKIYF